MSAKRIAELEAQVKALSRFQGTSELLRTVAVMEVDGLHGFTCEFAPSPAAHIDDYDRVERALKVALRLSLLGGDLEDHPAALEMSNRLSAVV